MDVSTPCHGGARRTVAAPGARGSDSPLGQRTLKVCPGKPRLCPNRLVTLSAQGPARSAMRLLLRSLVLAVPLALAYLAWPVVTALQVREAMVAGDTATLTRKIEWEALRA